MDVLEPKQPFLGLVMVPNDDPWMGFYLSCEEFCFDGGDCADSVPADFDVAACMEEFNSSEDDSSEHGSEVDYTAYGAADCDAAWDDFGLNCAQLEVTMVGIVVVAVVPVMILMLDVLMECLIVEMVNVLTVESYYCDGSLENGNASWGPDCANGADEVVEECCEAGLYAGEVCGDAPACSANEYDCLGDGTECIPDLWYCDGSFDKMVTHHGILIVQMVLMKC